MTKMISIAWFAILLFGCSSKKIPRDVLPPDRMSAVLWDEMRADAYTNLFLSKDSVQNATTENIRLQQQIFKKYHTDKATFYRSYDYYISHGDIMKKMLDSMTAIQSRVREQQRAVELKKLKEKNAKIS